MCHTVRSCLMQFLGFYNHEKGATRQKIWKWSTVCSTFLRSGWSVVRSALLAKGGTSKKRPSLHPHKVLTWSNKVSLWTFHTALILPYTISVLCNTIKHKHNDSSCISYFQEKLTNCYLQIKSLKCSQKVLESNGVIVSPRCHRKCTG
jgi:hypothetical protein